MPDPEHKWTISNVDGGPLVVRQTDSNVEPWLIVGESVEVVPADQLRGALSALATADLLADAVVDGLNEAGLIVLVREYRAARAITSGGQVAVPASGRGSVYPNGGGDLMSGIAQCECCGGDGSDREWFIGAEGEDICARCAAGLLGAERDSLRQQLRGAVSLLREVMEPHDTPCRYDHHDLCQAHYLHERPCPYERARAFLTEGS